MKYEQSHSLIVHRATAPTVNDNASRCFDVESLWYHGLTVYKLTSFSGADAIWEQISGGGSSAYELEITGDDNPANDVRTVTHGLNTDTPSGQLWYEYDTDMWRPLDWTQGITSDSSTPNQVQVNLMAYEGNTPANKYKIIVMGTVAPSNGITRTVENRAGVTATLGATSLTDYVQNCTGINILTLPTAVGNTNKYTVTVISGSTTINTTSSQTINGSTSIVMSTAYLSLDFISNGSNWLIR